jgi:hypothetical protein
MTGIGYCEDGLFYGRNGLTAGKSLWWPANAQKQVIQMVGRITWLSEIMASGCHDNELPGKQPGH